MSTTTPVPPARHLLRAKDLADARYHEPLDVSDLARAAHLSQAHFSREFRKAFGESPHQYLLT
ncbi:MAG TPA: helix-turn-helix transcriptional regulator, partial [Gaiellaceae bacterium]|nr:helix-turn-helix transcriptional regulator [Gaiellaceae bacterium]